MLAKFGSHLTWRRRLPPLPSCATVALRCPPSSYRWLSSVQAAADKKDTNQHDDEDSSSSSSRHQNRLKEHEALQTVVQLDFFGEPVTFRTARGKQDPTISHAMAALDGHLLAVVSKGKSCTGGGAEDGVTIRSNHAVALSWAELLRFAAVWQDRAPILTVVAVAPVLAHTGVAYVQEALDPLLKQTRPAVPGLPQLQCIPLAQQALENWQERWEEKGKKKESSPEDDNNGTQNNDAILDNEREVFHMRALSYLLRDEHSHALVVLLKCLQQCPGDALALSMAMDLSQTTGQAWAAGKAANTVAAYWYERRGGLIRPSLPGYSVVSSLIALGWAVDGRTVEAEVIADQSMSSGKKVSGAIATWALAHIFDATGRTAEGISFLVNFDGMSNYEGAGWLHTTDRWAMYGARYSLDREERGGRFQSSALRLYESHVSFVLETSGYAMPNYSPVPRQQAPMGWLDHSKNQSILLEATQNKKEKSWYDSLFGGSDTDEETSKENDQQETKFEIVVEKDKTPSPHRTDDWTPAAEDVLTYLPPTPIFLTEATLLLFRMTLNGTLSRKNERWDQLRNAWRNTVDQQHAAGRSLTFSPMAAVAASMVLPPRETGAEDLPSTRALSHGLHRMGQLLQFGKNPLDGDDNDGASSSNVVIRNHVAQQEPDFWLPSTEDQTKAWREVVETLTIALDGFDEKHDLMDPAQLRFTSTWEMDGRPILEHAVIYAACKAGDIPSLSLARSICSRGVSMRPNSPEEWWRYSIVLGLLGDQVASEDALHTSINVGGGQGSRAT